MAFNGLDVTDVVRVTINLQPLAAQFRNFGLPMILGSTNVIDVNERQRTYTTLAGIISDFGLTAPETSAATLLFSQSPQPANLLIGRWAQAATAGIRHGAGLTPAQQLIGLFNAVTSGSFFTLVDGVPYSITGLNFSTATNLNGVATIIQTALVAAGATGATVVWAANNNRFDTASGTTGVNSSVSYASAPTAIGNIAFTGQPTAAQTITLGGTVVAFVASGATGNQVNIGATLAATLTNLVTFLRSSSDLNIVKFSYSLVGNTLYLYATTPGAPGNSLTVATNVTGATASGATLAGATGTDITGLLGTSLAAGAPTPVNGVAAETLAQAVATFLNAYGSAYGITVASSPMPSTADHLAVAAIIEGSALSHIYGVSTMDTSCYDPTVTTDIGSQLQALGYKRTFTQFSSNNAYSAASIFGRAFTVDFTGINTTITLKFKQEPGIVSEKLTESQAAALKTKNINAFVYYQNGTAIIQEGVMASGFFFDEVHGTDWLQNYIQTNLYNLLFQSPTKIPQTDDGVHMLVTDINHSLDQSVRNGLVAPGVWNVAGFGTLKPGDVLTAGYYVYAPLVATQAQADREARKAPPIQAAIKLAGAIHFSSVSVQVNR